MVVQATPAPPASRHAWTLLRQARAMYASARLAILVMTARMEMVQPAPLATPC